MHDLLSSDRPKCATSVEAYVCQSVGLHGKHTKFDVKSVSRQTSVETECVDDSC